MFPFLKQPIIVSRIFVTKIRNRIKFPIAREKSNVFYKNVVARHQSVLMRKLGKSDQNLQKNKIINLKRACHDLNGLIIKPNEVFSLWEIIGRPTYSRGYVDGMLLSNGGVQKGVGGGLCQLSNFLCWLLLHADTKIIERYHHSWDVFPDSGRVLPFGSGATCFYNFLDLKVKNISHAPLQIKIWVTDTHLKGQLLSEKNHEIKFSIKQENHAFIRHSSRYYRFNQIWRVARKHGSELVKERIFTNLAPVRYQVTPDYLARNNYTFIDFQGGK